MIDFFDAFFYTLQYASALFGFALAIFCSYLAVCFVVEVYLWLGKLGKRGGKS